MLYTTQGIEMNTTLLAADGGFSAGFKRIMAGQNLFLADYEYHGDDKNNEDRIGLGTDFPSKIVRLSLEDYYKNSIICQKGAFLASSVVIKWRLICILPTA